jgi:hypothetical protein
MEIFPFLRLTWARTAFVVAAAAVAAAVAFFVSERTPATYEAGASVALERIWVGANDFDLDRRETTMAEAIRGGGGEGIEEITSIPSNQGVPFTVLVEAADPAVAIQASVDTLRGAVISQVQSDVQARSDALTRSETALAAALDARDAITAEAGTTELNGQTDALIGRIEGITQGINNSTDASQIADYERQLADAQAELDRLGPLREEYRGAVNSVAAAQAELDQRTSSLRDVEQTLALAESPASYNTIAPTEVSVVDRRLQNAAAGAIGVALALLGAFVVIEAMRRPVRPAHPMIDLRDLEDADGPQPGREFARPTASARSSGP